MSFTKTYLITGAAGFIGSQLTRRLVDRGEKVHIITKKKTVPWRIKDILHRTNCHISDMSDPQKLKKTVEKINPDVVYHLATYGAYPNQDKPDRTIETNILGTWNLLKAVSDIDYELFVNTGSSSEYGFKRSPMKETDLLEPTSYYAVTKSSQTLLCRLYGHEQKRPIVTLRPFSVYGPYEESTRFIPTLMRAILSNGTINLVSPDISRDFLYIDDLVDAYLLVDRLKSFGGQIFNIGTGVQSSIQNVVDLMDGITQNSAGYNWGTMEPRAWDTDNWVADISKAKQLLKWSPSIDLEQGLSLTWKWFKSNYRLYT